MKKIVLLVCAVMAMSSLGFAGGDMKDVEPAVEPVVVVEETKNGFYAGLGLSAVSTRDADLSMDFFNGKDGQDRLGNVSFFAGYNFNEYIAAEGRYATSISHRDFVEMDGWSLFVKPQYPVSENFSLYALLGFGGVTLDARNGANVDVDETGFQWGLGTSYVMMESITVFVDYTSLANDMDGIYHNGALQVDTDAITVGMNYLF